MEIFITIKKWIEDRRDRKAKRLSSDYTDIVTMYRKGLITAKGTGQSITDIQAEITSRVGVSLKVLVPHGTYFVSTGNHQNMVTRMKYRFELDPLECRNIHMPASRINAALPIPEGSNGFKGVARVSDKLSKFLEKKNEVCGIEDAEFWTPITRGY